MTFSHLQKLSTRPNFPCFPCTGTETFPNKAGGTNIEDLELASHDTTGISPWITCITEPSTIPAVTLWSKLPLGNHISTCIRSDDIVQDVSLTSITSICFNFLHMCWIPGLGQCGVHVLDTWSRSNIRNCSVEFFGGLQGRLHRRYGMFPSPWYHGWAETKINTAFLPRVEQVSTVLR